jgi:hypothetical protein
MKRLQTTHDGQIAHFSVEWVPLGAPLSREEIAARIVAVRGTVAELTESLNRARRELASLEARPH